MGLLNRLGPIFTRVQYLRELKLALLLIALLSFALGAYIVFSSSGRVAESGEVVVIRGAGATFPLPQWEVWIDEFMEEHSGVVIEYRGVGSGSGQEQFLEGLTDFCGSDPPLSRAVWEELRGEVLQLPLVLSAVAVVYNIPEVPEGTHLNLTGEVLALIYLGEIRFWDDPRIQSINGGVDLPHEEIVAIHRSDASGTTEIFTLFLHKSSGGVWGEELVGKLINWPVDSVGRGLGGKGNQGVASLVTQTPYSVGYIQLSYAIEMGLPIAAIENPEGVFVLPTEEAIMSAVASVADELPDDPRGDFSHVTELVVFAPGRDSYPITTFSYMILRTGYELRKAEVLREFIEWVNTEGMNYLISGYVPLPEELRELNLKAVELIEGGG